MLKFIFAFTIICIFYTKNVSTDDMDISSIKISAMKNFAEMMKNSVDSNVDPCINYLDYICDGIDNTQIFSISELIISKLHDNKVIKEIIEKYLPRNNDLLDAEIKMVNFLKSCENNATQDPKDTFKQNDIFHSIKNWPAFDDRRINKIDIAELLGESRSLKFSLGINMEIKRFNNERYIYINPDIIQVDTSIEKKIRRKGILHQYGIEIADKIIRDVEEFERIYSNTMSIQEYDDKYNLKMDFEHLKIEIPEFDWDKYFEVAAGVVPDDSYPVIVDNSRGVKRIIGTISGMEPRIVVNFVFYQFIIRIYQFMHHSGLKCYDFAFLSFPKVITRLLANNLFNGEYSKFFFDVINSVIETLSNTINIFNSTTEQEKEKVDNTLFNVVLTSFVPSNINKIHKNLRISSYDYWGNVFRIYREIIKRWLGNAIATQKSGKEIINEKLISYILATSLYEFNKKPAALQFDSIASPILVEAANWIKAPENLRKLNETMSECHFKQLEIFYVEFMRPDVIPIYASQLYMDAYNKWAKRYGDLIKEEDEILEDYHLSNKQILFTQMQQMAMCTPNIHFHPKKKVLEYLNNLDDFITEYGCPEKPLYKKIEKC